MGDKLPSFQFYPGDWMKDPNLRRCSHASKGVLMDVICLMFECEERGVLATAGLAWTDDEIAQAIGGDRTTVTTCLSELTLKGVLPRNQSGALYSKRLVRDEHKRKLCSEAGKRGGSPLLRPTLKGQSKGSPKGASKGDPKPNPTPSTSTSTSSIPPPPDPPGETVDGTEPTRKARPPDPVWDCIAEIWHGGAVAKPHTSRVGKQARDFKDLSATPEEIRIRLSRLRAAWKKPGMDSAESLIKHWKEFAGKTSIMASVDAGYSEQRRIEEALNQYAFESIAKQREESKGVPQ